MNSPRAHPQRFSDYAHLEKEALLQAFHIDAHGYSDQEVARSRAQYGSNAIHKNSHDTIFYRLRRAFVNPFTVILFVLAAISFVTDVLLPSDFSRDMTTVLLILSMLVISGVIRFIQEMRAKRIADHLTQLFHTSVMVRRNGDWTDLPASELVVGDTVQLAAGDRVPADMRLIDTSDFFVSQAIITGESAVLEKMPHHCRRSNLIITAPTATSPLWAQRSSAAAAKALSSPSAGTPSTAAFLAAGTSGQTPLIMVPTPSPGC